MPKRTAALCFCLALAGCAGGGALVHHVTVDDAYSTQEIGYAAAGSELLVEIAGNPFAVDDAAFGAGVTEALQGAGFGPAVRFTTEAAAVTRPEYRLRLWFNGPATGSAATFCRDRPAIAPSPGAPGIRLLAGFCRGERALTYASAETAGAAGPGDPAFRAFLRQVATLILPANQGPNDADRCVTPFC